MPTRTRRNKVENHKSMFSIKFLMLAISLFLSSIGIVFIFEASSIRALSETGNSFNYMTSQLRGIGLGVLAMIFFAYFKYKSLYYLSLPLLGISLLLLFLVLIPSIGTEVNGARRWIDLGIISFQPTELAKFSAIIYLSSWFTGKEKKRFYSFLFLIGLLMFLILLQPDMGTAIIIFSLSIILYFLAGKELIYLWLLVPISIAGFIGLIFVAPYRLRRLTTFLNPDADPLGMGYHINQIFISLSGGGLTGKGFGASRQKYLFLPEAHTDSIFAIIGEELGFIGSTLIIFLYFVLLYKLYGLYKKVNDEYARLLVGGIFAYFGMQVITNLGSMVGLMPLTGATLPFISFGSSNLLISFALVGIAINIARTYNA